MIIQDILKDRSFTASILWYDSEKPKLQIQTLVYNFPRYIDYPLILEQKGFYKITSGSLFGVESRVTMERINNIEFLKLCDRFKKTGG